MASKLKTIFDIIEEGHNVITADRVKRIIVTQQIGRKDFPLKFHREIETGKYDFIGLQVVPPCVSKDEIQFQAFVKKTLLSKN